MNNFSSLIENSKQAVRYWWLLLIIGIALFAVGVLIFVYPAQSYLGMSLVFGWLMLISGILEVVLSSANKHFITGRGWMMAGGIIEIILGIILIFNVGLSAATLPIFLGFWLMMRGFSAIGLGGDMSALEIAGSGWTIFTGVLLLLCSLCVIFAAAEDVNPDGYAFNIDSVNVAVAGEKTTIITKQDLIPTANMKWSVNIVLDKVADGLYKAAGDAVPGSGSDPTGSSSVKS